MTIVYRLWRRASRLVATAGAAASCSAAPAAVPPPIVSPPPASAVPHDLQLAAPAVPAAVTASPAHAPDRLDIERRALGERLRVPLVSADARIVMTGPKVVGDGEGTALVTLTEIDTDRDVRSITVQPSDPPDVQHARIAEAQAVIDKLDASPLVAFDVGVDPTGKERLHGLGSSLPMAANGDGLRVRFHEPTLLVDQNGGPVLFRRAFPQWSLRERVAGQRCLTFADLRAVWGSRKLGVLLVEIGYSASPHFCSFAPSLHAVRFARP